MPFYICDLRPRFRSNPYVTFWRTNNSGYAYPLCWSGVYTKEEIEEHPLYYWSPRYKCKRAIDRFPVDCETVDRLATAPEPGMIDGDKGPVIKMTAINLRKLRKAAFKPETITPEMERNARALN